MNMTRKRSPRKKWFEFCHHLTFERWFLSTAIGLSIIFSSICAISSSALQKPANLSESTPQDVIKLSPPRANDNIKENVETNHFHNTTIDYKARGYIANEVETGSDRLVGNKPNLNQFPAKQAVIENKMAANVTRPRKFKDRYHYYTDQNLENKLKFDFNPINSTFLSNKNTSDNFTDVLDAFHNVSGEIPCRSDIQKCGSASVKDSVAKLKNANKINDNGGEKSDIELNKSDSVRNASLINGDYKNYTFSKNGSAYNGVVKNISGIISLTLSEDENEKYGTSVSRDRDEYDRTTKRNKLPEEDGDTGALGVLQKLAEGVLESLAERVIPQGLRDIFRRVQDQNSALETLRLRGKEENGGLGIFGRSLLKGIADPITSWMHGTRDNGSLDSDRGFLNGMLAGVAGTMGDAFKIKVTAIYPGTLWCGDGHLEHSQSVEVGLFFMTDNCCRRHDSCRLYILAGESDYGLTNTGLFTRSHCSCDSAFYRCLKRANTLVSSQIGGTFFSILGPQCFRREHPIIKCARRTRITGQKCEEYVLDKTQPKIWQWFDNPTF